VTIIYQLITVGIILLVAWNLFREKRLAEQMAAALVLIPLILRALMIR